MEKAFPQRVNWRNLPNRTTPINETNLNKSDAALRVIDDRVITLDTVKFDKSSANALIKNFQLNQSTGVITITRYDNSTATFDTALEKIAVNFDYDDDPTSAHYQSLILYDKDGHILQYVDLSTLITEYEFDDTSTIAFTRTQDGHVKAQIKTGSVTDNLIQPHYLADITLQALAAAASAEASQESANDSEYYKNLSISYAVGSNGEYRDIDATDNAKYYKEQANSYAVSANLSKQAAEQSETNASTSELNAADSEANALISEGRAATSATNAATSATVANTHATNAHTDAQNASASAIEAESYAHGGTDTRTGEDTDNGLYYLQKARDAADDAQAEADRASLYVDYIIPRFIIQDNRLYMQNNGPVSFVVVDNRMYVKAS